MTDDALRTLQNVAVEYTWSQRLLARLREHGTALAKAQNLGHQMEHDPPAISAGAARSSGAPATPAPGCGAVVLVNTRFAYGSAVERKCEPK